MERATSLTLGGHCSYVYVPGTTWAHTSEAVVAYEYSDYHAVTSPAGSIFVLFADGHVELINKRSADFMRAELAKGQNPPRWEQIGGVK